MKLSWHVSNDSLIVVVINNDVDFIAEDVTTAFLAPYLSLLTPAFIAWTALSIIETVSPSETRGITLWLAKTCRKPDSWLHRYFLLGFECHRLITKSLEGVECRLFTQVDILDSVQLTICMYFSTFQDFVIIPCHFVASYPGPAQLSVASYPGLSCFSVLPVMESWVGPGYEASHLVFHDIGYVRMHKHWIPRPLSHFSNRLGNEASAHGDCHFWVWVWANSLFHGDVLLDRNIVTQLCTCIALN